MYTEVFMGTYQTKLVDRKEVAEGTYEFTFEKPAGFEYTAGQNADFTLTDPPQTDPEGNKRTFSLTSAPFESALNITTRMRDTAFKNSLKVMPFGSEIQLDGPYGSLTLHNDEKKPAVFLAGGIGITPFFSMIKQATQDKKPHQIYLFYSNRRPEDAAFLGELTVLETENPNFKMIATMTEMAKSMKSWPGETAYIDKQMLQKYIPDLSAPIYYIAGPANMVVAMKKMLVEAGINSDNIRTEDFTGY